MVDTTPNPYVGPRPFERKDSARFFGRDQEARELLSLIVANRMVVFYAQSGAGKTSLLNAQVAPLLEAEGFEVWPFARVQGPEINSPDPAEINNIYALYALFSWAGNEGDTANWANQTIPAYLQAHPLTQDEAGYEQPRVLIFDQLEELFTAYPARWQEREGFLNQIARALDNDPLLRVVFSLREDYVAQLDPYAHLLPRNLGVRFRLERMRPEAALSAIRSPLRETERNFAPGVAEQLVEDLRAVRAEVPGGGVKTVTGEFVEPVQLQVVCQNLWEDLPPEVSTITAEHLRQFGDVDQALSSFYTRAINRALPLAGVNEEELRQWFETSLITPAGTRGTVYRGTQETAGVDNTAVQILEDMHIIRGEIRAGSRWYELTHDRLIEPIQQANRQWHDARQAARIKRIRQIAIGIVTVVLIIGLGMPFLSLLPPNSSEEELTAAIQATGTGQAAMQAEMNETATAAWATATADTMIRDTAVAQTAVYQDALNATATADIIIRDTAVAQTAVYQDALNATATMEVVLFSTVVAETAVAQQTLEANLMVAAAEATRTFAELERLRVPVRPLQPGISIGNQNSNTAGTLSAFVVDDQGVFYLLGPSFALGAADAPVLQPSPIDGGQPENAIAITARRPLAADLTTIDAAALINLARLEPGIAFQTTVPGIGPLVGTRLPVLGETVWVYGRTSGLVQRQISCLAPCRGAIGDSVTVNADFALDKPMGSGDEGALVLDGQGYVIGIVAANSADVALGAGMTAVLEQFAVELVTVGQQLATLTAHQGAVHDVAFSLNGQWMATAGEDGIVRLWDTQNTLLYEWRGHANAVFAISFTPDDQWVTSTGRDATMQFWPVINPNVTADPLSTGHTDWVYDLAISPDGNLLATASQDSTVRLWRLSSRRTQEPIAILTDHQATVFGVAFSPDSQLLASAGWDRRVRVWDVSASEPVSLAVLPHNDWAFAVAFSPDGEWLATSSSDGLIRLWSISALKSQTHQQELTSIVPVELANIGTTARSLAFSRDGKTLAAGTDNRLIFQWNMDNWDEQPLVIESERAITAVAYHPNNNVLAAGLRDGHVGVYLIR
ncbi:MAG TPA: hypothetical protein PLD25_22525 [Chloroflexota bacterium]|nr:hypothetical protein [Chloroflexota bacterium]